MPGPFGAPLLDDFNRANGAPGANWAENIAPGLPSYSIVSNVLGPNTTFLSNYWAASFAADQEAFVTVKGLPTGNQSYLMCRIQDPNTAGWDGYQFTVDSGGVGSYIEKIIAGGTTFLASLGTAIAVNDVIALTCQGSSIKGWKNGVQIGTTVTDTSITGAGYIGIRHGGDTPPAWDDFGGGSITVPLRFDTSKFPKAMMRSR